ncbi:hypothetical protein SLA2020_513730 [Shorea laevis]
MDFLTTFFLFAFLTSSTKALDPCASQSDDFDLSSFPVMANAHHLGHLNPTHGSIPSLTWPQSIRKESSTCPHL